MQCKIDVTGNMVSAFLDGEIDHHTGKDLREQIDLAIEQHMPANLMLDFGNVTFMDSSGIGLVMGRYRNMQQFGGKVHILNPSPSITKVLRLAGMDRLAAIENN